MVQEWAHCTGAKSSQELHHHISIFKCVKNPGEEIKGQLGHRRAEAGQLHGDIIQWDKKIYHYTSEQSLPCTNILLFPVSAYFSFSILCYFQFHFLPTLSPLPFSLSQLFSPNSQGAILLLKEASSALILYALVSWYLDTSSLYTFPLLFFKFNLQMAPIHITCSLSQKCLLPSMYWRWYFMENIPGIHLHLFTYQLFVYALLEGSGCTLVYSKSILPLTEFH